MLGYYDYFLLGKLVLVGHSKSISNDVDNFILRSYVAYPGYVFDLGIGNVEFSLFITTAWSLPSTVFMASKFFAAS